MCTFSWSSYFFYSNTLNPKPSTFQIFFLSRLFPPSVFLPHFTHKTHRQTHRKYKNVFFDVHRCFREAHLQGTPPPVCPRTEDAFSVARPRARALSDAKSAVQRVDFFVFFFCEAGTFFLGTKDKKVDYTRGKSSNDDDVNDDDANAGVYFFTPSRRKNAHASRAKVLARLDATEHARAETSRFRRRLFFSHKRAKGAAVWILKFHSIRVGRSLVSYLLVDLFRCPIQQNARADRGASLFPSPMNGRTNEQVNFKTSRTATKARAGFSVNAAAVRLPFCISRRIVLDRVHEELSKKKSESFIDFFLSSKKTLTRRLIKKSPIKKSENVRLTVHAHLLFVFTRPRRAVWRHSRQGQRHHLRTTWHGPRRRRGGLQVCRLGRGFFGHRRNHDGVGRTIRNHARRRRGREDWHRSRSGRHDPNSNRRVNLSVLFLQTKNKFSERREEREREREREGILRRPAPDAAARREETSIRLSRFS